MKEQLYICLQHLENSQKEKTCEAIVNLLYQFWHSDELHESENIEVHQQAIIDIVVG